MRIGLTILAVLLILALTAALVGPYFVDWSAQRTLVAAQLSRVLGERVNVRGAVELRLLPSPYITLGQVEIADPKTGGALFSCDDMKLELGLTSLVRGQFRFTQALLDRPIINLGQSADGGVLLPELDLTTRSDSIALDDVVIRQGRMNIAAADGAAALSVENIDLDAQAESLLGPFKGSGEAAMAGGRKLLFHFATGAFDNGNLRLKAVFDAGAQATHGELDGALVLAGGAPKSGLAAVGYSGDAVFSGSIKGIDAPMPWRAAGALKADLRGATLDNLNVRLGAEDRALAADGSGQAEFGATPRAHLVLAAKQLNFDTLLRVEGADSATPTQAFQALSASLSGLAADSDAPLAVNLQLDTPAAILGGDTIADISVSATIAPGKPPIGKLEASPPGRSHILASGAIDFGPAAGFKGTIDFRVGEAQRLRDWLTPGAPELKARLAAVSEVLPYRSVSATGDIELSAAGFAARNLNLSVERSTFTGTLALTRTVGAERGRLFMDLRTDSLDIDALPTLGAGGGAFDDVDLALTLDARAIRIARLGEGELDGGSLAVKLIRQGEDIWLDRLSIADLGGASVEASGAVNSKGRSLSAKLDAERLRDFALLLRRVAPGRVSEILVDRAGSLSPAKLTLKAGSTRPDGGFTAFADSLAVQGVVGATHVDAKFDRALDDAGQMNGTLSLDAPDAAALLRQIGVPALSQARQAGGHIGALAHGRWGDGLEVDISASLAGADLALRGRLPLRQQDVESPLLAGAASVKTNNATPLLAVLGIAPSDSAILVPVDLSANLAGGGERIDLSRVIGTIGRSHFAGDLTYWRAQAAQPVSPIPGDPDVALAQAVAGDASSAPSVRIEGVLSVDRLPLSALTGLALGASQPVKAGALWSDAKFSGGLVDPPATDIALKIATLDITDNLLAHEAAVKLKLGRGLVALDDLAMTLGGGGLTGHATIRRDGPNASLSGQFSLEPVAVDRPGFAGRISGAMDFAGTGQSAAALVAGLAGAGRIRLADALIPRLDQGALGRILEKAKQSDYAIDQTNINHALDLEFNKQSLRIGAANGAASMTAGIVRFGPFEASIAGDKAILSANFNVRTFVTEITAGFFESQAPKYWSGAPPSISVVLRGPIEAPTREIDSTLFVAGLAAQALARETERIAALESDIRERAFFNRRLKAGQFMRRRELELEAFSVEQARLKSEVERRRVESEILKADDAKRKALAPAPAVIDPLPPSAIPIPDDPQQSLAISPTPSPPTPKPRPPDAPQPDPTASGLY